MRKNAHVNTRVIILNLAHSHISFKIRCSKFTSLGYLENSKMFDNMTFSRKFAITLQVNWLEKWWKNWKKPVKFSNNRYYIVYSNTEKISFLCCSKKKTAYYYYKQCYKKMNFLAKKRKFSVAHSCYNKKIILSVNLNLIKIWTQYYYNWWAKKILALEKWYFDIQKQFHLIKKKTLTHLLFRNGIQFSLLLSLLYVKKIYPFFRGIVLSRDQLKVIKERYEPQNTYEHTYIYIRQVHQN